MNNPQTYYWHDYETFGTDPRRDRPVQFAGVRTDFDFNILDDPLVVYCKPALDCLPNPEACLITGITPQHAEQYGVCEAEFIRQIHNQLSEPRTCTVGYNSIRFDDEVTRNCLYRNFYDPYSREWLHGNSRWDLIDVVRAARALRPEGFVWPVNEEGDPSFRLDQLTEANNIAHDAAHDALSDVYATIAIAKLIKNAQPKLFNFLFQHRVKAEAFNLLQLGSFKPVVHISGRYSTAKNCMAVVLPVCKHPGNNNGVIVYDLSVDPEPMLSLSVMDIQQRIFTATADLPDGVARVPLKTVHINKCPVLAPISVIRPVDAERLKINLAYCQANIDKIKAYSGLSEKLAEVFDNQFSSETDAENGEQTQLDPDLAIYSGGFFSDSDKNIMTKIRRMAPEELGKTSFKFIDSRLPEMLFRYRARNFPQTLNQIERSRWIAFCVDRLSGQQNLLESYFQQLNALRNAGVANDQLIDDLEAYAKKKMQLLGMLNL